jgi:hypothetical protein
VLVALLSCHREADVPLRAASVPPNSTSQTSSVISEPRITIDVPSKNEYFRPDSDIIVVARVEPSVAVKSVGFYSNGTTIPSTTTDPLRTVYHPAAAGPYSLKARAELDTGLTIESAPVRITVDEPHNDEMLSRAGVFLLSIGKEHVGVVIRQPSNGAVVNIQQEVRIEADAESARGTIAKVVFSVDGHVLEARTTRPYEVMWRPRIVGHHLLTAHVRDTLGHEDESNHVEIEVQ